QQPLDIRLGECRHGVHVELPEGGAEGLALAQDGGPRQPRLETFQAEPFEQPALVAHRHAPFGVVVVAQKRVVRGPGRPRQTVRADDDAGVRRHAASCPCPLSSASNSALARSPPAKPVRSPKAPTTRWQGATMEIGLRPLAAPTARTALARPICAAMSL